MEQNSPPEKYRETAQKVTRLEIEMATHEVQCEERWKTSFQRLDNIDAVLGKLDSRMSHIGMTVILFLAGVIVTLATLAQ